MSQTATGFAIVFAYKGKLSKLKGTENPPMTSQYKYMITEEHSEVKHSWQQENS